MVYDAWLLGDVLCVTSSETVVLISEVVGKRLLSVTHLGNFVCGDSKPRSPRLFSSRSPPGTEAAFAELIIHNKTRLNDYQLIY